MQIDGAERLEFDVYKEIFIGDPDVFLEISSRLTPNGDIEVTQALVNNSEVAHSFDFRLYAPRRPYVHAFEIDRGFGRWETVYTIPNGVELIQAGVTEALLRGRSVGSPEAGTQPMVYSVPLPSSP